MKGALQAAALAAAAVVGGGSAMGTEPQATKAPEVSRLTLAPCDVAGVEGKARCGTYEVYENRSTRKGRKISLKVVVVPATGPERLSDPYVFLDGGPGEASTEAAAYLAREFAKIRQRRDILLVDQRGTGGSHPLNCPALFPPEDVQSSLGDFFPLPLDAVRKCREGLEKSSDLTLYTTSIAMDDLDEVRAALGYDRLNLAGGSYGTRAALVYLRQHPDRLRTLILQGVEPTDDRLPLHIPRGAERALAGVLEECAAEPACKAAFPSLREEAKTVFASLSRAPVTVRVLHPRSGEPTDVVLSHDLAAEAVRYMLYSSGSAGEVPTVLHQAAAGDFTPLAELAIFYRQRIVGSGSNGLYLSITCAEDVPWIEPGEGERAAQGTFIGDYRLKQQRAACELWPRAVVSRAYFEPVSGSVPVLLLSGKWDPATPPSNAEAVARHLPNALHAVVPHGGHNYDGLEGLDCLTALQVEFIERGTTKGLDTACVEKIRRLPFRTEPMEMRVVTLPEENLASLAGPYVEEGGSAAVTLEVKSGKLVLSFPDGDSFLLVPVAATRFRVAGAPNLAVSFELVDGRPARATIIQSGTPVMKVVPKPSAAKD